MNDRDQKNRSARKPHVQSDVGPQAPSPTFSGNRRVAEAHSGANPTLRSMLQTPAGQPAGVSALRTAALQGNTAMARLMGEPAGERAPMPSGPGAPLPEATRSRFEQAFGHDFSHVRVHDGHDASLAATQMNAEAFAIRGHLYFGPGRYAPGTPTGDRLLAHELTHVVQHDEGRLPTGGGISEPSDPAEREAYRNEVAILSALPSAGSFEAQAPTIDAGGSSHSLAPTAAPTTEAAVQRSEFKRAHRRTNEELQQQANEAEAQLSRSIDRSGWTTEQKVQEARLLAQRILTAISQHETGQEAKPSDMRTTAGVPASYDSRIQATTPWMINRLKRGRGALRTAVGMPDGPESHQALVSAEQRAVRMGRLYDAVMSSGQQDLASLTTTHQELMAQTGMTSADLQKIVWFRNFKDAVAQQKLTLQANKASELATLTDAQLWERMNRRERRDFPRERWAADPSLKVRARETIAQRTVTARDVRQTVEDGTLVFSGNEQLETLIGRGGKGMARYAQGGIWAEDRAAWQRASVDRMDLTVGDKTIGQHLTHAAEAQEGLLLGWNAVYNDTTAYLTANPQASHKQVIRAVATIHNGSAYANKVYDKYRSHTVNTTLQAKPLADGSTALPGEQPGTKPFSTPIHRRVSRSSRREPDEHPDDAEAAPAFEQAMAGLPSVTTVAQIVAELTPSASASTGGTGPQKPTTTATAPRR